MKQKEKIVFIGSSRFSSIVLEKLAQSEFKPILLITEIDKPVGRKQILTSPPVKPLAEKYKIPITQVDNIRDTTNKIQNTKPGLILVASYGQIIPKDILEIPKIGCLNIHPSLLPRYRGPSPIQQAIINGENETGVTIIKMTENVDAGPIIAQRKAEIDKLGYKDLEEKLANLGTELFINILPDLIKGNITPKEQNKKEVTFTKIIKKEDGKINWSEPADLIERKIRAFEVWPQTYTTLDGKRFKILRAFVKKQDKNGPVGPPGKIYLAPDDQIAIQCGKDYLVIEELQIEGKKPIRIEDFLKGHIDIIGKIFI